MLLVIVSISFFLNQANQSGKFSCFYFKDNKLIQTISEKQNRAAEEKKTSLVEVQSLWTPLTQLGEQLTLALVCETNFFFETIFLSIH